MSESREEEIQISESEIELGNGDWSDGDSDKVIRPFLFNVYRHTRLKVQFGAAGEPSRDITRIFQARLRGGRGYNVSENQAC